MRDKRVPFVVFVKRYEQSLRMREKNKSKRLKKRGERMDMRTKTQGNGWEWDNRLREMRKMIDGQGFGFFFFL